jgi:transposase-like protein
MKNCPRCKSASRQRTRRKGFVKLIPGTKGYACEKCNTRYAWFGLLNLCVRI